MANIDIKTRLKRPTPHPLKFFFKSKGINQTDIAYHLGISPSSICQIFNGIRPMPLNLEEQLRSLAELIDQDENTV